MKKYIFLGVALATSAFAISDAELLKSAQDAGLEPLPTTQKEVDVALEKLGVKPNIFSIDKAELGKKLYFDTRLSKSGIISCNTCHNLALGGVDGVEVATGHKWSANPHGLNSPTTLNSAFNAVQFWDGRAADLSAQAKGPIEAEVEMAAPADLATQKIASIPQYSAEFEKIYGKNGVNFENIADAIATFERTLMTPSRFDKFLRGDKNALNKDEKVGLATFIDKGCAACHTGINLGGTMQSFDASKYEFKDIGDFKGDANELVKTPTLRNITQTAPYFHNGKIWKLSDAIKAMGSIQLGIDLSDAEVQSIEKFLGALDGKMPEISYPVLPASTQNTPKPEL